MNISVISIYSFPEGLAATNRIIAYSLGLINDGSNVDVFIPFATDGKAKGEDIQSVGQHRGINYYYPLSRYSSKYRIIRGISYYILFKKLRGYLKTYFAIIGMNKKKTYDCVIISTDAIPYVLSIFVKLKKINNCKIIFIFDEFPNPIRNKLKNKIPQLKKIFLRKALIDIDGYVSISQKLSLFYNRLLPKPTMIMPVIVDTSRFDTIIRKKIIIGREYLCYMGNLELTKDNVDLIIKAFAMISVDFPLLDLHLYGGGNRNTIRLLLLLIKSYDLENRVILKGRVDSRRVPQILSEAKVLVSSQPDTVRASGGFPTKLGEYLMSGIPCLLTDVGENSKYVKHKIHAFFVPPNDIDTYSDMLIYILENYSEAKNIALCGKKEVFEKYSHISNGIKLKEFIDSL